MLNGEGMEIPLPARGDLTGSQSVLRHGLRSAMVFIPISLEESFLHEKNKDGGVASLPSNKMRIGPHLSAGDGADAGVRVGRPNLNWKG